MWIPTEINNAYKNSVFHPEAPPFFFLCINPASSLKCSGRRHCSFSFKHICIFWGQTDQEVGWTNLYMTAQIILSLTFILSSWVECQKSLGNQRFVEPEKSANTAFTKDALGNFFIISFYVQKKRDLQGVLWKRPGNQGQEQGEEVPLLQVWFLFFINTYHGHLLSFSAVTLHRLLLLHLSLKDSVRRRLVVSLSATPLPFKQVKLQVILEFKHPL